MLDVDSDRGVPRGTSPGHDFRRDFEIAAVKIPYFDQGMGIGGPH